MALTPAVGDLLTVNLVFTNVATATAINVLHYRVTAITGVAPGMYQFLSVIAKEIADRFSEVWEPWASDQVKFVNTRVWNVFPLPRSVGVNYVFPTAVPGADPAEALPLQDAVTILKRTEIGNRTGLGRMYVTGISESSQSNGIISNLLRGQLNTFADRVGQQLNPADAGWGCTIEPVLVNGPEDNPVRISRIIGTQVSNNILKTQRRRRPGKGI